VFISTVHTRYGVQSTSAECTGNFGFLHEQKLLNTAVTRAKSWVAVVGDPILLCSVGSCSPIWKTYLKRCFRLNSVQPAELSLADIYAQSRELISMNETSFSKWSMDFSLAPDEIIQRLGVKNEPKSTKTNTSITYRYAGSDTEYETDVTDDSDESDEECQDVSADNITRETDECEPALVERLETEPEIYKRCTMNIKLANLAHAVVCDSRSQVIEINGRKKFGQALHGDEVVVKIVREENSDDSDAGTQDDTDSDAESVTEGANDCLFGKVIGILKRAFNPINRTFICRKDNNNCGNMIPLNFRIPIIKILFCEKHRTTQNSDVVCLYQKKRWKHVRMSSQAQLFKVKILKWRKQKFNPLGCVVAVVKNPVEKIIDFLEQKYEVQKSFSEQAMEQAGQVDDKVKHKTEDYRKTLVFTIDEPKSKALDDALSVEALNDGYQFGIHIADVSSQVPQDSPIDKDARTRCVVLHAVGREHNPMLPVALSEGVCSLLPGEERPTISVFIKTDCDYNMREEVVIKRCRVCSGYQLTYDDVEERIARTAANSDGQDDDDERRLLWSIHRLKEAAVRWRIKRLGYDRCYRPPKIMSMNSITARTLVEEMMITANYQVAKRLVNSVPRKSPLRHKLPISLGNRSVDVNDAAADGGGPDDDEDDTPEYVQLDRSMCIVVLSALHSKDTELVKSLITNMEHQFQLALESVNSNQPRAKYICSGNESTDNWRHCGLNLSQYAHFTSPIRRYIDIIVHRMLLSVIEPNNTDALRYTKEDIAEVCEECNGAKLRAHELKYDSCSVRLCSLLRERTVVVYAVVCAVTESDIVLLFPNLQYILTDSALKYSSLKPSKLPQRTVKTVTLKWKQRIYDLQPSEEMQSRNCKEVKLDPRYRVHARAADWKKLVHAVSTEDEESISEAVSRIIPKDDCSKSGAQNLSSEGDILRCGKHFCEYAATFSRASIVKVQLAANDGYKSRPHIQLFHLTPVMCVCVEHNASIVESFSKPAVKKADVNRYHDIGHYQKLWRPVLAVEAAYSAVTNGDSVIVHHVDIAWKQQRSKTTGTFEILTKFCKDRNITFPVDQEPAMDSTDVRGYMCVRYSNSSRKVSKTESALDTFKDVIDVEKSFTWVGHCVVTRVVVSLDNTYYVVHLLLTQTACPLPEQKKKATIEWIPKLVPDR